MHADEPSGEMPKQTSRWQQHGARLRRPHFGIALLLSAAIARTAAGAPTWHDGNLAHSTIINCPSLAGTPYQETGAEAYAGFYADQQNLPKVGEVFWVHVVFVALGAACSGQQAYPEITPPAGTQFAISATDPVYCYTLNFNTNPPTSAREVQDCPQQPKAPAYGGAGGFGPLSQSTWPLPQGRGWEIQVPLRATQPTGDSVKAYVKIFDGNNSPVLSSQAAVLVQAAGCTNAAQCSDGNPCTTDTCAGGACAHTPVAAGTSCSDGNACNGAETCQGGTCTAGTAPVCNDSNPCTTDSCAPASGCVYTPITGCTGCTNATQCSDGNACTIDTCSNGACGHAAVSNGTSCGDGNACNGNETCQGGSCIPGFDLLCHDGNPCTTDSCSAGIGCIYTPIPGCNGCASPSQCDDANPCTEDLCVNNACGHTPVVGGASCSDGNVCNGTETCQGGTCNPGTALVCNDGDPCTADSCNAASGCTFTPIAGCGGCTSASQCDDANSCTTDRCTAGGCQHDVATDGTPCDDGAPCTTNDVCAGGQCAGVTNLAGCLPVHCSSNADCYVDDPCTEAVCTGTHECAYSPTVGIRGVACGCHPSAGLASAQQICSSSSGSQRALARFSKACARIYKATTKPGRARQLVVKARKMLRKVTFGGPVSPDCSAELRQLFSSVYERASNWLRTP